MIACILLSAGLSTRFGSPKALAKLNGRTVIEYVLQTLIDSKLDQIIVVLGAQADEIKAHILKHKKVKVVYNKDYNLGQTSSFKAGLEALQGESGIMLLPVDLPCIKKETIDQLIDQFLAQKPKILIPTYQQKRGHPPLFASNFKELFLGMDNLTGINSLEHQHESEIVFFPVDDPGIAKSFNTQEEFNAIRESCR